MFFMTELLFFVPLATTKNDCDSIHVSVHPSMHDEQKSASVQWNINGNG